jgi:hypothetical protein
MGRQNSNWRKIGSRSGPLADWERWCFGRNSNLVGDVKDHGEPTSDLRIDIGNLRINLIVDLLLAYRLACYLAS